AKDFAPVVMLAQSAQVIVVPASLPVYSIKELIALAKAKPGELNYVSAGAGGAPYLGAELFKSMAGVNIVEVRYKGAGPGTTALVAGETQVMVSNVTSALAFIK